jgi:hypothetical protein
MRKGDGTVSSDLAPLLRRVNDDFLQEGLSMTGDPAKDPLRFFFRSDNAPYAVANLPTLQ